MPNLHRSRNLPWSVLVEFHDKSRSPERFPPRDVRILEHDHPDPGLMKRVDHFAERLEHVINEFSATESAKFDRKKVDSMEKFYPDSLFSDVLTERFQTPKGWNEWLSKHRKQLETRTSEGGELCDVVKELFNKDMMAPLLYLARNVPMIERLSFITYSNFFHYGYRRVLEDALICYLVVNYLVASDSKFGPADIPDALDRLTMGEDHDASLAVYKQLIGNYKTNGIPDKNVKELQRFSFRCLYQYQLFWDEVCSNSKADKIDWKDEIRLCTCAFL